MHPRWAKQTCPSPRCRRQTLNDLGQHAGGTGQKDLIGGAGAPLSNTSRIVRSLGVWHAMQIRPEGFGPEQLDKAFSEVWVAKHLSSLS